MIIYTPLGHYVNVTGIAKCITDTMTEMGIELPNRVCAVPGSEIAWDDCECGQLAILTSRIFPSLNFPIEFADDGRQSNCGTPYLVVQLQISMTRCVPGANQNGKPPTCEALAAATLHSYEDAYAVLQGTSCCVRQMKNDLNIAEFLVGAQDFVGPAGRCAGSTTNVFLGYTGICCG